MRRIFGWVILALAAGAAMGAEPSAATRPTTEPTVAFETYDGYFVSNKFEPDKAASFVVLTTQADFGEDFGAAFVMHDKSHRLAKDAFDSSIVVAVVKRGKAMWDYAVTDVVKETDGSLTVRYTATPTPSDSAEYACPLILSVPKDDYAKVRFEENGKVVGSAAGSEK